MFSLIPYDRRHNIYAYNPFRAMDEIERNIWKNMELPDFKTDIVDNGEAYEIQAELPGFDKNDISIDIEGDTLTISAERNAEKTEQDKKGRVIHSERTYGAYTRSFNVAAINTEAISASYDNGVLRLNMPKKENAQPTSRKLTIG